MWDHSAQQWSQLGSGVSARVSDIDIDGDWVYAAGDFTAAGGIAVSKAAKWNRVTRSWANIATDPIRIDNPVYAIDADGPDVFLGGQFLYVVDKNNAMITVNSMVWWNATNKAWYALDGGLKRTSGGGDLNGTVWDILVVGNDMFVAGDFDKAGDIAAKAIARYNFGSGWSALTSGLGGGVISTQGFALALAGQDVLVGGSFKTAGGVTTNHIARWSIPAGNWSALGTGVGPVNDADVQDVSATDQAVYVVGKFDTAGGLPSSSFGRYAGQAQPPPAVKMRVHAPLLRK
jgi:hypothetical protein